MAETKPDAALFVFRTEEIIDMSLLKSSVALLDPLVPDVKITVAD